MPKIARRTPLATVQGQLTAAHCTSGVVTSAASKAIPVGDDVGSLMGLWRRQLQVGQPLPTLPLPLSVHQSVTVDLEETYKRAAQRAYLK